MKVKKIIKLFHKAHSDINHFYDGNLPYSFHLNLVAKVAEKFIPKYFGNSKDTVLLVCHGHDLLEDTHYTYNDVKKLLLNNGLTQYHATMISESIYALTNNKGRNRRERADDNYYKEIDKNDFARFVKLCDRIANVIYSKHLGSSGMYQTYKKEMPEFLSKLPTAKFNFPLLFVELENLIKDE